MSDVKYPDITVKLTKENGNAFHIIATVSKALEKANISNGEIGNFRNEALSGDYNHLLQTCMKWVNVE